MVSLFPFFNFLFAFQSWFYRLKKLFKFHFHRTQVLLSVCCYFTKKIGKFAVGKPSQQQLNHYKSGSASKISGSGHKQSGISSGNQNKNSSNKFAESSSAEEEFFCLTPEDARSISSNTSDRSRNASSSTSGHQIIPDSKIFSVAVEAKASQPAGSLDNMMVCDVDTDYTGRFAVVSSSSDKKKVEKKSAAKKSAGKKSVEKKSAEKKSSGGKRVVVKQVSKEFKLEGDDAVDQTVGNLPEVNNDEYCTIS